ncbi:MAG: CopG family transcriptional regulator [Chloroflexi bacterium]|nr:CopG family transcriptional regulator [Chloroflexota bacterium]
MANIKTAISIQESLFQEIDLLSKELNVSRSRLFSLAAQEFIDKYQNQKLLEQLNKAYEDGLDADERVMLRQMKLKQRKHVEGEW